MIRLRHNNEKGFAGELVLLIAFVFVLGLVGYSALHHSQNTTVHAQSTADATNSWGTYLSQMGGGNENKTPTPISNLSSITRVQAGNASYMALDSSGTVWTWGIGANGVLGDGNTKNQQTSAVKVKGLPTITAIGEADNTDVALDSSGNVWGWGWNEGGQLCQGNTAEHDTAIELKHLVGAGVVAMAGGGKHMLYLLSNGTVEACGNNTTGDLGNGTFTTSLVPVTVTGLPAPAVAISAGPSFSTALFVEWSGMGLGANQFGQLGNGTLTNSDVPVQVQLPTTASQVYSGGDTGKNGQSLALLTDGTIWGWGNNQWGQLGNGTKQNSSVPVKATSMPTGVTFKYVASGGAHSLALDSNGNVWAWGDKAGIGSGNPKQLTPIEVLSGADMISATANDSVAHLPAP